MVVKYTKFKRAKARLAFVPCKGSVFGQTIVPNKVKCRSGPAAKEARAIQGLRLSSCKGWAHLGTGTAHSSFTKLNCLPAGAETHPCINHRSSHSRSTAHAHDRTGGQELIVALQPLTVIPISEHALKKHPVSHAEFSTAVRNLRLARSRGFEGSATASAGALRSLLIRNS